MSLNIAVNDDYIIKSDTRNIIVTRKHIVDPTKSPNWKALEAKGADSSLKEEWREISYHSTISQAIRSIGEQRIRDSDATTLAELLAEIKRFNGEIEALLAVECER